jgi:hypothetical protein
MERYRSQPARSFQIKHRYLLVKIRISDYFLQSLEIHGKTKTALYLLSRSLICWLSNAESLLLSEADINTLTTTAPPLQ